MTTKLDTGRRKKILRSLKTMDRLGEKSTPEEVTTGEYEYPETTNGAYKLLVHTSRKFGESILRGGRRNLRNERGHGVRTSVMFTQKRGDRGERNSTPGRK